MKKNLKEKLYKNLHIDFKSILKLLNTTNHF